MNKYAACSLPIHVLTACIVLTPTRAVQWGSIEDSAMALLLAVIFGSFFHAMGATPVVSPNGECLTGHDGRGSIKNPGYEAPFEVHVPRNVVPGLPSLSASAPPPEYAASQRRSSAAQAETQSRSDGEALSASAPTSATARKAPPLLAAPSVLGSEGAVH